MISDEIKSNCFVFGFVFEINFLLLNERWMNGVLEILDDILRCEWDFEGINLQVDSNDGHGKN